MKKTNNALCEHVFKKTAIMITEEILTGSPIVATIHYTLNHPNHQSDFTAMSLSV